jgi:hypothetical protein
MHREFVKTGSRPQSGNDSASLPPRPEAVAGRLRNSRQAAAIAGMEAATEIAGALTVLAVLPKDRCDSYLRGHRRPLQMAAGGLDFCQRAAPRFDTVVERLYSILAPGSAFCATEVKLRPGSLSLRSEFYL